jgi:hypothetical protein
MSWDFAKPHVSITHGYTVTCLLRAHSAPTRSANEAPGHTVAPARQRNSPPQQRAEILKSLKQTSSLSEGLRNFM